MAPSLRFQVPAHTVHMRACTPPSFDEDIDLDDEENEALGTDATRLPPEVVSFWYNGQVEFAPAVPSYEDALDFALSRFTSLHDIPREHISFHAAWGHQRVDARIAPRAWQLVVMRMPNYEDITISVDGDEKEPLPRYSLFEAVEWDDLEESADVWRCWAWIRGRGSGGC
ncbi:hypothetical protein BC834DRAFT_284651 [Gloeopeniophorella convolvens]|nr:hypothetical protein BC834DRAFT_284651 [Gloeopeniophorella convolvens]